MPAPTPSSQRSFKGRYHDAGSQASSVQALGGLNHVESLAGAECSWPRPTRYRSGTRGYMKTVVLDLLRRYLQVEHHFQQGKTLPHG